MLYEDKNFLILIRLLLCTTCIHDCVTCIIIGVFLKNILKVAFEGLKHFPRRKDIATKQACYLNTLKEQNKRKELQRLAFAEREHMVIFMRFMH